MKIRIVFSDKNKLKNIEILNNLYYYNLNKQ